MRFTWNKAGLAALVALGLVFMAWLAGLLTWGKIPPGTKSPPGVPPGGRIFLVQEVEVPRELTVLGTVVSKTLAQVSPQVAGRVKRVFVEAGSRVKAGEPLVELSAQEFQAKVSQAQGAAAAARADLAKVEADFHRYRRLFQEGAVSPQEFEAMSARYQSARAALGQAQAQVSEAAAFSGYTVVKAPRAGVVAERRAAVGDLAQPGQPLVALYDPGELQVEGEVNDDYRVQLREGLLVRLEVPALSWEADSTLAEIFPISQAGSRTFKVRTPVLTLAGLVPGMFARLSLPLGESRGLLIPRAAVREVGQLTMVEVLSEGRGVLRLVKPGRQVGDRVEVLAGLQAGDRVLVP